jgi:[ribosomal protein S5]-alanine N-acetyltransferase
VIETERLVLRLPGADEAAEVARYYRENDEHLRPWSPPGAPFQLTPEYWAEQLPRWHADQEAGTAYRFFLFKRTEPATAIGTLSLTNLIRGAFQQCFLGYTLAEREQGHGYAVEAVEGAVRFAFHELRLHRVSANYMPENTRSGRVLRRCGFRVEGYAYDYLFIAGRWADHILTSRTNPDRPHP